ncbi:F-box/LRR-repeat protein At2g43260-like [Papaver somniferum]|uniref:F-box/LRR-repeat protein At2g43260-like n=1 Tax=Papaver somniferum TaxID=3469 RepID=UPI000E7029EC|nr:F-box/LRR-repeat protein At2g43260-like [Papaver somniferum]
MGNFNMLPYEIMFDIFIRLPIESVLECKLVSKPWRDLVRHPSLAQMHLNHLNDSGKLSCIFYSHVQGLKTFYYSEYDDNRHEAPFNRRTRMNLSSPFDDYYFNGSCNGLICFDASLRDEIGQWHFGPAHICNPITREYVILPRFKESSWWTGFGHIPSSNGYKVVRIYNSKKRNLNEEIGIGVFQVYTLGSVSGWRNVGTTNIRMKRFSHSAAMFANGALFWKHNNGTTCTILAFHLADEKLSQLPPPPPYLTQTDDSYISIKLGVLGDFLSATHYYDSGDCDIWLLKKNEDNDDFNWIKVFSLDNEISRPFEFTKSGRLLCYGKSKIYYSYDPKASSAKIDISSGKSICEAIPHKNTLISLKVLGEMDTKTMEFCEMISSSEEGENSD